MKISSFFVRKHFKTILLFQEKYMICIYKYDFKTILSTTLMIRYQSNHEVNIICLSKLFYQLQNIVAHIRYWSLVVILVSCMSGFGLESIFDIYPRMVVYPVVSFSKQQP